MARPHLEVFASEFHMLQFFGKYLPKLDVMSSGALSPFLYKYDGKLVLSRNLFEFLTQIEDLTALGIDTRASVQKNKAFLIFFKDGLKNPEDFILNSNPQSVLSATISEDIPMQDPTETPVITTEVSDSFSSPDTNSNRSDEELEKIISQAESLRNDNKKSAAKADLESFAANMGISLSKSKTFDGMMEDLRSAL